MRECSSVPLRLIDAKEKIDLPSLELLVEAIKGKNCDLFRLVLQHLRKDLPNLRCLFNKDNAYPVHKNAHLLTSRYL